MRARSRLSTILAVPLALAASVLIVPVEAVVPGTNVLYTLDADFDQGVLQNVNHDTPNNNQLQLNRTTVFFPFVNIAASTRGTMVRIDVNTGAIVGEWWSAPDGRGRNPSRTTVDRLGNTWLSNRNEAEGGKGSVTRVGVIVGGTRVNSDGSPNPLGDFLAGPFGYNTCVDRNGDGLIATSRGLADIRPWTNAGGADTNGGVTTAADECLINYTRVTGTITRTVAVDANNDVWTGGGDNDHEKLDGMTGQPVPGMQINFGCGGYGGLVDQSGTLWSARFGTNLLRYQPSTNTGACLDTTHGDYGLGLDPNTNHVWHTGVNSNRVVELDPAGNVLNSYPHGNTFAQGVAVDRNHNVWVAHSILGPQTTVGHIRTDGTFVGNVPLPGGAGPTVVIDPSREIYESFVKVAEDNGLLIINVIDTHQHADHVSGVAKLVKSIKMNTNPEIFASFSSFEEYNGNENTGLHNIKYLRDGDVVEVGENVRLKVIHTPGHTKGSLSFFIEPSTSNQDGDETDGNIIPYGYYLFTGDTLFIDGIGRPDLKDEARDFAGLLYETYHQKIDKFPLNTLILPAHFNAASVTLRHGIPIHETLESLKKKIRLLSMNKEEFVSLVTETVPPKPMNYKTIISINKKMLPYDEVEIPDLEAGPNSCSIS